MIANIQKIEKEVAHLPSRELARFRVWFERFDAEIWDKQIQKDVEAGRFDSLANEALKEFKKGKCREL